MYRYLCLSLPGPESGRTARRSAVLGDVLLGVLVADRDARGVLGLEHEELHRDVVPGLQVGVVAEVEQVLPLLLGHVVVVGLAGLPDRRPPRVGADLLLTGLLHGVADLVVVLDRVLDLLVDVAVGVALAEPEQPRVEELLLRLGVHLEEHRQPRPHRTQGLRVVAGQLVEDGEHPPLLAVLVEDDLGDVHAGTLPAAVRGGKSAAPAGAVRRRRRGPGRRRAGPPRRGRGRPAPTARCPRCAGRARGRRPAAWRARPGRRTSRRRCGPPSGGRRARPPGSAGTPRRSARGSGAARRRTR